MEKQQTKRRITSVLLPLLLFAAGHCAFYFGFVASWRMEIYLVALVLLGASLAALLWGLVSRRVFAVLGGVGFAGFLFGVATLCRTALDLREWMVALIFVGITGVLTVVCLLLSHKKTGRRGKWEVCVAVLLSVVCAVAPNVPAMVDAYYKNTYKRVAAPAAGGEITKIPRKLANNADFYVSPEGSDENDGSKAAPFLTIDRAKEAVRALDKTGKSGVTVALLAGDYRVNTLEFTAEDSGTKDCPVTWCAYGDGEVLLNGGVTIPHDKMTAVTDETMLERFSAEARKQIFAVDLFSMGVTAEDYGKIYAVGGYHTAARYDGDWVGENWCELFIDDARQTIARYPNGKDYLYTGEVVEEGEGHESASARVKAENANIRNPKTDVYKMDEALSERIRGWKNTENVWMFGYWRYDWADASTPLGKVDHENMTISPLFVSTFGAIKDAPYYFFNVPEELDAPGEWYLDRENGVLYFYPPEGFADTSAVELSLSAGNVIHAEADFLTFDGFTIKGTRGDAVNISGDGNTVKNCRIKNVAGNALLVTGYDNLVTDNEITHTGKGGVILDGGDRETLTPGNNRAENNWVHDWSEIYETYQPAFTLNGVGNVCSHNEMYNSPHEAITYSGNNHLIEYNLIHDVNLLTDDGGAIYSGRRWDWYGTVIRYNLIYDLGADGHRPQGIYMDDALAGQTIYGNVMVNVPNFGLQLGGGQDLDVHDNIVINSYCPISYDDRGLTGLSGDESSSFYQHYKQNGDVWKLLYESPWQTETWLKAYPQYLRYSDDFNNTDDRNFVLNPGNSTVTHNLLISARGTVGDIADTVYQYSTVEDNPCFKLSQLKKIFVDPENGDYTVREDVPIDFKPDVPAMSEFGRQ